MTDRSKIAAAIGSTQSEDVAAVDALRQQLLNAIPAVEVPDLPAAEDLLACILESFIQAGPVGKELLDQLLLDILPGLAALAPASEQCSASLCGLCGFAASACTPRETITVFLEVMDQLLPVARARPHTLCFLCTLLGYLPQLLAKLPKHQVAFTKECLTAAAALAKAHGEVLNRWMLLQLRQMALQNRAALTDGSSRRDLAASEGSADQWHRADTFLAACWQPYNSFVADVLHKVVVLEADDAATQQSAKNAAGELILHLVLWLTTPWQPAPLHNLALQLSSAPAAAAQLPTTDTVTAPVALLAECRHGVPGGVGDDAAVMLCSFLELLQKCGVTCWTALADFEGEAAAGAAMVALYDLVLNRRQIDQLQPPPTATETLQLACRWAVAVFHASEGNPLVISKAIAFLQAAAQLAKSMHGHEDSAEMAADSAQTEAIVANCLECDDNTPPVVQLLPDLQPAIGMLAISMIQAGATPVSSQAALALQQLLRALPPGQLYASLKQMLSGSTGLHHEVAALLMQEVRVQLAQPTSAEARRTFTNDSCIQLVLPWLQPCGSAGWANAALLPEKANVICAALAIARMAVLKLQRTMQADSHAAGLDPIHHQHSSSNCWIEHLRECLSKLSEAVPTSLQQLQQEVTTGHNVQKLQGLQISPALLPVSVPAQQAPSTTVSMPGEASGTGQAVDAWLAVSRVQDVLDRVLELLHSCSGG